MAGGSKREYRKYEDKIRVLREAAACDETDKVLEEARQVTQRPTASSLAPGERLLPSLSLPDFNRALSHHSGGGVMVRPRSPGGPTPYSRSTSSSPVRSPSPRVVTLRHRDPFRSALNSTRFFPYMGLVLQSLTDVSLRSGCRAEQETLSRYHRAQGRDLNQTPT